MVLLGCNFVTGLICTMYIKSRKKTFKNFKNLKTFPQNLSFSSPGFFSACSSRAVYLQVAVATSGARRASLRRESSASATAKQERKTLETKISTLEENIFRKDETINALSK